MSDRRPEYAGKDDRVLEKPTVNLNLAASVVAASTAISWQPQAWIDGGAKGNSGRHNALADDLA